MTHTTTVKERREMQLERHYNALNKLAELCGINNPNGKKLSNTLRRLEFEAHKLSTDYCNGENGITSSEIWEEKTTPIEQKIMTLFNNNLKGFFVNGDARGYALKIRDSVMRADYKETGLQTDWGGYGLLAPEITGK